MYLYFYIQVHFLLLEPTLVSEFEFQQWYSCKLWKANNVKSSVDVDKACGSWTRGANSDQPDLRTLQTSISISTISLFTNKSALSLTLQSITSCKQQRFRLQFIQFASLWNCSVHVITVQLSWKTASIFLLLRVCMTNTNTAGWWPWSAHKHVNCTSYTRWQERHYFYIVLLSQEKIIIWFFS